jgi:hypothetical protein
MQPDKSVVEELVALARAHRPQWSWARMREVCSCGAELPCRKLKPLPASCANASGSCPSRHRITRGTAWRSPD